MEKHTSCLQLSQHDSKISMYIMATRREQVVPMPTTVTRIANPAKKKCFVAPSIHSRAMNDTAINYMQLCIQTNELPENSCS